MIDGAKIKNNHQYVAFLRGINMGGHAVVKMTDLRDSFESMGFQNVRTVLASGNVVFDSAQENREALKIKIQMGLNKLFKKDICVILRNLEEIKQLQVMEPFKAVESTPSIRLNVTFLAEETKPRTISIPNSSPNKEFLIIKTTPGEIFSVLDLSKGGGTPEVMNILEKEFGANITTRNWNTILKILK